MKCFYRNNIIYKRKIMVAIIEEEITIKVLLAIDRDTKLREYKVDEWFSICDLKDKLFKIYGIESFMQRIMVKKEGKYDLVNNKHKKLVNGRKYMVVKCLHSGARISQRYNAHYWHIMKLIENKIK